MEMCHLRFLNCSYCSWNSTARLPGTLRLICNHFFMKNNNDRVSKLCSMPKYVFYAVLTVTYKEVKEPCRSLTDGKTKKDAAGLRIDPGKRQGRMRRGTRHK